MRVPIKWLKEYVSFSVSAAELAEKLTMTGTAVEAVEPVKDDTVLELEITPNRPDCLGMIGVAREVAAVLSRDETSGAAQATLKKPEVSVSEGPPVPGVDVSVKVDDPELCPRYAARVIVDVTVGDAPGWMRDRLKAAGVRSLNNLVDVTNYVMLETGQPLHAFDLDRVKNQAINVRRANAGEALVTLDGVTRRLTQDMLVIADDAEPLALGGIMGGGSSEVSAGTKRVLLESAHFEPKNIMRSSRTVGLMTESSTRFEKGVDPNGVRYALDRAAALMTELAGGSAVQGPIDDYQRKADPKLVSLRPDRVSQVLGVELGADDMVKIFTTLELPAKENGTISVEIPTFRPDLNSEIDLIEEVARVHGYGQIDSRVCRGKQGGLTNAQAFEHRVKDTLVSAGMREVINYSFMGSEQLDRLTLPDDSPLRAASRLENPLTEEQALMRTTTLPAMIETVKLNVQRGAHDLQLFEVGRVFLAEEPEPVPEERVVVAGVLTGRWRQNEWYGEAKATDFFDAKGVLEQLFSSVGAGKLALDRREFPGLHPGRTGAVSANGEPVGLLAELRPDVLVAQALPNPVVFFELDLRKLRAHSDSGATFRELPRFPGVTLDLAVVIDEEALAAEVAAAIHESGGALLETAHLFDHYSGKQIPAGKKSLAYGLLFRHPHRTLSEAEVKEVYDKIVRSLRKSFGAEVRT